MKSHGRSRIRAYRALAGFSQRDLAARAGVSRETISLLERGDHQPTFRTATALAEALNCPVTEILNDEQDWCTVRLRVVDGARFEMESRG